MQLVGSSYICISRCNVHKT